MQIGKTSGRRSNTTERTKSHKQGDSIIDYPTLKLSTIDVKKEHHSLERRSADTTDGAEPPKHAKFGIKVLPLPANLHIRKDHHNDNEQNIAIECELTTDKTKTDEDGKDVKAILSKGLQNLKEKINQNTLGRKKKEGENIPKSVIEEVNIPEEVARAGAMAQNNRKSVSAESLAARKSVADILPQDSDTSSEGRGKKPKGKAPAPPQVNNTPETKIEEIAFTEPRGIFEPLQPDSDSEAEGVEMTCTQATVHHSPVTEEPDSSRKAASLGDLSRLEEETPVCPLERAVSLDMNAAHGKKRKAPPPPEDFPGAFEESYRKEPRLEGINTFQRRLKKSSDFGTLEDALHDSDSEEISKSPEPVADFTSTVANNIQEFSSWLEEVRKPQNEMSTDHHLTLNVNGNLDDIDSIPESGKNAWDISADSDILYSSALSTEVEQAPETNTSTIDLTVDNGSIVECALSAADVTTSAQEITPQPIAEESIPPSPQPGFTFSVNGLNLQEPSRTVLLISQPNSLDAEDVPVVEDETPPQLPTSPPPSTSLTYITEIRVSTPEPAPTPPRAKPQRKDLSPEASRIPVRTMKSETGQKVLAAIQSLAGREIGHEDTTPPSVAGFHLKKVPPVVPPRRNDSLWVEGMAKDRINGTPIHHMQTGVSLPVKTSATKIIFESQDNNEEF